MTDEIMAACAGLGLSAACGFRVFVPLLAMGVAVHTGHVSPGRGFEWIGTWPAMVMLGVATATEVAAFYVPYVDHLLDVIAAPASVAAGTVLTASVLPADQIPPTVKWAAALIAGGGAAGVIQTGTAVTRALSTATTGGLRNHRVATIEHVLATVLSVVAILVPLLAVVLVLVAFFLVARVIRRWRACRRGAARDTAIAERRVSTG